MYVCKVHVCDIYFFMVFTQIHRRDGWGGEETVEISGSAAAKATAQELIKDTVKQQGFRSTF